MIYILICESYPVTRVEFTDKKGSGTNRGSECVGTNELAGTSAHSRVIRRTGHTAFVDRMQRLDLLTNETDIQLVVEIKHRDHVLERFTAVWRTIYALLKLLSSFLNVHCTLEI